MPRILVLGSNSFAGSQYIAYSLNAETQIMGINRSAESSDIFLPYKSNSFSQQYTFKQLDLNKDFAQLATEMELYRPEYIVDFAGQGMVAESWQQPEQWYQTNILAKVKLHSFLKDKTWLRKYIRVSTPEVYGSSEAKITESAHYNPSTPYAVSHAATDMSLMAYYRQYDFPVVFTRFSNFYGAGQQLYRIIPRTIIYALSNKTLSLHGGGKAVRAFIHGKDIASAIQSCISKGEAGQTYHFSTDSFISVKYLVEKIHAQMQIKQGSLVEVTADRPGKDLKYLMDDTKARTELTWTPNISLDEGITDTIKWVQQNLQEILHLPLEYQHKA